MITIKERIESLLDYAIRLEKRLQPRESILRKAINNYDNHVWREEIYFGASDVNFLSSLINGNEITLGEIAAFNNSNSLDTVAIKYTSKEFSEALSKIKYFEKRFTVMQKMMKHIVETENNLGAANDESSGLISEFYIQIIDISCHHKHGEKFFRMFVEGDSSGFKNRDGADLSLTNILSKYFYKFDTIDWWVRQSKLYRPKWESSAYSRRTINKSIALRNKCIMRLNLKKSKA